MGALRIGDGGRHRGGASGAHGGRHRGSSCRCHLRDHVSTVI